MPINPKENELLCLTAEESLRRGEGFIERFPNLIRRIIELKAWEERDVEHEGIVKLNSLRELITEKPLRGWGTSIDKVQKLIEHDAELLALWRDKITEKRGGDRVKDNSNSDNITNRAERGTNKAYTVARLKRDHPAIFERVKAGEISAHKGAIEAGIVKVPTPLQTAINSYKKLTDEEKEEFKKIIFA